MKVSYWAYLLTICVILPLQLSGQEEIAEDQREDYALLWEISGNGLDAPSYLFGSMHVRYNAAFEFPDSLLLCLQACDAIANEIQLDSAMQRFYEIYYGSAELDVDSAYILQTQNKSAKTDSLDQLYAEANPPEEFDIRSFFKGLVRTSDIDERGFQRTMLDAYLMDVARSMGKTTYGLENIDEHFYEPEYQYTTAESPSPLKSFLFGNNFNTLLDIYYQGNINAIDTFMRNSPGETAQLALIPRNYIMRNSMMRIMEKERLFSVVGAAHLPGPEGVIQLLREEGFKLRRVQPTFTGLRDSLQIQDLERPWAKEVDSNSSFSFAMPWGTQFKHNEAAAANFFAFDIGRGLNYLILKTPILPDAYDGFDEWFFRNDGYTVETKENITHLGVEGTKYALRKVGEEIEHFLAYVFIYDQEIYYLQIGAYDENELNNNSSLDNFLTQFEILKKNSGKWTSVVDSLGGFRVRLPQNYSLVKSYANDQYEGEKRFEYPNYIYRAGFEEEKASVWVQYFDVEAGSAPVAIEDRLAEAKDGLVSYYGIELDVTKREKTPELTIWELQGEYPDEGLLLNVRMIIRDNRLYVLRQIDRKGGKLTKKFTASFELLPLAAPMDAEQISLIDDQLELTLPVSQTEYLQENRYDIHFPAIKRYEIQALDEATSASYRMDVFKLPRLFSTTDTAELFRQLRTDFATSADELSPSDTKLLSEEILGQEWISNTTNEQLKEKIQLYAAGPYWVRKRLVADSSYLDSPLAKSFFEQDRWAEGSLSYPTLTDRSQELIEALKSEDSLTFERARMAFDPVFSINNTNRPAYADLLIDNNWDSNEAYVGYLNHALLKGIQHANPDSLADMRNIFERAQPNSAIREAILVSLLPLAPPEDNPLLFELFFDLLQSDPLLSAEASEEPFLPFMRKADLFVEHWTAFEALLDNSQEPLFVWQRAAELLGQDSIAAYRDPLLASAASFARRGGEQLDGWTAQDTTDRIAAIFSLYELLPDNPLISQQVTRFLNRAVLDKGSVLAASYLIARDEKVPKQKLKAILANKATRIAMVRLLNKYDRLNLLKKSQYEQEEIAKAIFLEKMSQAEPDATVSKVAFIETQEVLFDGEIQLIYLFSFQLDESENHLGIAGFFSTKEKEQSFRDDGSANYTLYTISSRKRTSKAEQLVEELGYPSYDFDFGDY